MSARDRLRIAIQKSGRLSGASLELLKRCGLEFRQANDNLFCLGETLPVDLLLVRDDDIPSLIASGACDLGIVGRNVLHEQALGREGESPFRELRPLGFGSCRLSLAVPQSEGWQGPHQLVGRRIATTYPNLLRAWLRERGIEAEVVTLSGSVEIAPRLGTADLICDLVSSGATLAANQLREVQAVMDSEAVLASTADTLDGNRGELLALLLKRLDGARESHQLRLLMLKAPRTALPSLVDMLPGPVQPTVTSIDGRPDDIALQWLCSGQISWQVLENMQRLGAHGMLVLPVEKMLA